MEETQPFVNRGPALVWILGALVLMMLTTFAGACLWTCWVERVHTPSHYEPSHPPPAPAAW